MTEKVTITSDSNSISISSSSSNSSSTSSRRIIFCLLNRKFVLVLCFIVSSIVALNYNIRTLHYYYYDVFDTNPSSISDDNDNGGIARITTATPIAVTNNVVDDNIPTTTTNVHKNAKAVVETSIVAPPSTSSSSSLSACVLIKDDNDIINEWIAYHYHTWNLRYLIVAIDPSSSKVETLLSMLEQWKLPPFHITVDIWNDTSYMPTFFLQRKYHLVPNLLISQKEQQQQHKRARNKNKHLNENMFPSLSSSTVTTIGNVTTTTTTDLVTINNHRYRQLSFLDECIYTLRNINRTWMMHIDTDEYIVMNPLLRNDGHNQSNNNISDINTVSDFPKQLSRNVLYDRLQEIVVMDPQSIHYPCISMPRLRYGSIEDTNGRNYTTEIFDESKFETLRWKYHAPFDDGTMTTTSNNNAINNNQGSGTNLLLPLSTSLNGPPKVLMDVSAIPKSDKLIKNIMKKKRNKNYPNAINNDDINVNTASFSIHRPSVALCRKQSEVNFVPTIDNKNLFTVNHYIGSWSRYNGRSDPRRSKEIYIAKANVRDGRHDNWINSWLDEFVKEHGIEDVARVLASYV